MTIETYGAVSRLLWGQAIVERGRARLTDSQVGRLCEALEPHDLTADLRKAIETALHAYRFRGAERGIYEHYKTHQRPIYERRLKAALMLRRELDPLNDRKLIRRLDDSMAAWAQMADLIPNRESHRPRQVDMQELGTAVKKALQRAGVPLKLGRATRKTVYMEVLDLVRRFAEPHITPRGTYAYARAVLLDHRARAVSKTTT